HSQPNSSMFRSSFVPYFSLLVFSPRTSLFKSLDPALCRNPRSFVRPPPSPSCPPYLCVFYIYLVWCCFSLLFFLFSRESGHLAARLQLYQLAGARPANKEKVSPSDMQQSFISKILTNKG